MRKLGLLTAAAALAAVVGFSGTAQAATVYSEGFEAAFPPAGWTLSPLGVGGNDVASANIAPTAGTQFGAIDTSGTTDMSAFGGNVGATLVSNSFAALSGDVLTLDFQFLTSDGTNEFRDFAFIQLRHAGGGGVVATLANANTTGPVSQAVPALGGPAPAISAGVVLAPATAFFNGLATGPVLTVTYGAGKFGGGNGGGTGFITSTFTIPVSGTFELFFVVADFGNAAFDSALAIDNILVDGPQVHKEITSGPCASEEGPCEIEVVFETEFVKVDGGVDNPSFDAVPTVACTASFDTIAAGGDLPDWSVDAGEIDLICSLWQTSDGGTQSLDMAGFTNGTISQALTTVIGRNYEVTFDMSGNSGSSPGDPFFCDPSDGNGNEIKRLNVSVDNGGGTDDDYTYNVFAKGNTLGNMLWEEMTFAFTADDTTTVLTFEDTTTPAGTACGAALDNVMLFQEVIEEVINDIAVAVEAPQTESLHYDFKITARTDGLTDPVVFDTVPAEWDVDEIDGELVTDTNVAGKGGVGLGCGEEETDLGTGDNVDLSRGGTSGKKCQSDTDLVWDLAPDVMDMIRVDLQSRLKNRPKNRFSPTGCGALFLNHGAVLLDGITPVAETPPLCVAAVKDIDGDGVMGDGTGDEDNDNLDDFDEACTIGTDPCLADTDGDGVQDDVDNCPLEGPPVAGEINVGGCNEPAP